MTSASTVRVPNRFQGPTGFGQGGWTACRLSQTIGEPVTVAIRAPIPLETELTIARSAGGFESENPRRWELIDPEGAVVLRADPWTPDCPDTAPITIAEADAARSRFMLPDDRHPVPHCFACGLQPDTMAVHAGPLGDGRFATAWSVPSWASRNPDADDPLADDAVVWGALDCTAAMFVGCEGGIRTPLTVQYAVEILESFVVGRDYALVAWPGDWEHDGWDGRKRGAASAAFDQDGKCVARATSFWVAMD